MILLATHLLVSSPEFIFSAHEDQRSKLMESIVFNPEIFRRISSFFPEGFTVSSLQSFSNDNFLLTNEKEKIVVRISNEMMNFLVDRHSEYKNSFLAQKAGFNPLEILFFDLDDGLQVTQYLEKATFLSMDELSNERKIYEIVDLLRKLHESKIIFENKFNPFCRLKKIFNFLQIQREEIPIHLYDAYSTISKLEKILEWSCFENKPCHNDPVPSNFVLIDSSFKLIDWEYSGSNDPAWDLAYFSSILSLSNEQEKFLINCYSSEQAGIIQAKMNFFKPVIHLTISIWAALQSLENSPKLSRSQFENMSAEHFEKYQKWILSEDFTLAIALLKKYSRL
ncbi:MAG: choline kinase family protein [Candidatus Rhabdochlamydia sp.]